MISYAEALRAIKAVGAHHQNAVPWKSTETIAVWHASGRTLAESVVATIPSPPFTNSAMDGFAVSTKVHGLEKNHPVVGTIFARPPDSRTQQLLIEPPPFQAVVRIMTGAPVPTWADAVIPVELTTETENTVSFLKAMTPGQNIRYAGEDIAANDILLSAGDVLTSERIMALIACGLTRVTVRKGPSVLILSTGDELVEPGTLLADGQIINSSKYFLATALDDLGLKQVRKMHLADDLSEAQSQLNAILNADAKPDAASKPGFIISTGAVSAGQKDFVPDLLNSLGFEVLFHKVAIRPGKPVLVAAHPISGVVWLGLPGNPISTAATWLYFARPLLNALGAYPAPKSFWAKLAHATRKPQGLRAFFRGHLNADGSINVPGSQGSAHFRSTLTGNCWVELSEDTAEVAKDTLVRVTLS